jgi:hypothetical protein
LAEFSISLYENPIVDDSYLGNFTPRFSSWRHSIRDLGGCWQGEGEFIGTSAEMENFFLANLGKRRLLRWSWSSAGSRSRARC